MKNPGISTVLLVLLCLLPENSFGYIDPGSGSYLFQILLAALFGSLYAIKIFWDRLKSIFSRLWPGDKKNDHL
jgi:hypothetical protein